MRPVHDIHGGKPKDYTDTLIYRCDECIKLLESVKERAHDDCPYEVEYYADCAKRILREICEIAMKCSSNYELTSDSCANEARPTDSPHELSLIPASHAWFYRYNEPIGRKCTK